MIAEDWMMIPLMLEISDQLPDYGMKTYDRYVVEAVQKAQVQLIPEDLERRTKTEEQGL